MYFATEDSNATRANAKPRNKFYIKQAHGTPRGLRRFPTTSTSRPTKFEYIIMATGRATVEKSLDALKSTVTSGDARIFSDTRLEHVWQAAREIEREQGARMDIRCTRRIEPFLRSLESYAPTIEVFCQGFSPMAFVWVISSICLYRLRELLNRLSRDL